ncbi:MAG: XrtA/PEP-CTERM system TPR-repeat protein PrsT, partial [Telluria sp.]
MRRPLQQALRVSIMFSTLLAVAGLSGCSKDESSASLLADAKQYQQKGDNKAALIQLKNAASKNPEDAEVRFALASLYVETGDPVSAEKEIRKAMSLGMDKARATPLLARSLLLMGQAQQALDASNDAPSSPELLVTRGDAFASTGAEAKAAEAYEAALAAKPGTPSALIGLARQAMARSDVAAADAHIAKALAANPKDLAAWMFKGAMLRATGKTDEALAAYSEVIKIKPDHVLALVDRAQIQVDAKSYAPAQADLDAARKAAPNSLVVMHTQALLHFKQNNLPAAKEAIQQVTKLAPNYMPAVLLSGAIDLSQGAYQQGELSLKRYVANFPDNAYARKLLAQAQLHTARPAEAAATLAPLIKDDSQDSQLMALAGMSAAQSNDAAKASAYFQRASTLDPKSATIRTSLGMAKLSSGNADAGIRELEKSVEMNPASEEALLALVRAQLGLKQFDQALATIAKAEKQHASNEHLQNLKGGAYLAKGDIANARSSFDKAVALKPTEFAPVMNLAQLD